MSHPEDHDQRDSTGDFLPSDLEHEPVLLEETLSSLLPEGSEESHRRAGTFLDLTVGLGGHLLPLADRVGGGSTLIGFDRDPDALTVAARRLEGRRQKEQQVRLIHSSFAHLAEFAGEPGLEAVAGILLDLGLSSRQLNDAGRGFAFRLDGPLDMRFDHSDPSLPTAAQILAQSSPSEIADIFYQYGEERHSRRLARAIDEERRLRPILTTADLVAVLEPLIPYRERNRTLARLFQALRIAVNRELEQIERVLPAAVKLLAVGGRFAVITYHSLEDRIVKQYFRKMSVASLGSDGHEVPPSIRLVTKKPIEPSESENSKNSRARSAKLRVVERV